MPRRLPPLRTPRRASTPSPAMVHSHAPRRAGRHTECGQPSDPKAGGPFRGRIAAAAEPGDRDQHPPARSSGRSWQQHSTRLLRWMLRGGARSNRTTLRVGASSALATWWLVRHLPTLRRDIRRSTLISSHWRLGTAQGGRSTCELSGTRAKTRGGRRLLIAAVLGEQIFPLCAPHLLPRRRPLTRPRRPAGLPLIHKGDNATGDWGWPSWFQAPGMPQSGAAASSLTWTTWECALSAARPRGPA